MATVLDNALASQLQQAFKGTGASSALSSPEALQGLENEFQAAISSAQPVAPGQVVNGTVVVDSTASSTAVQSTTRAGAVSATRTSTAVDSKGSNFVIDGLAEVREMFTTTSSNISQLSQASGLSSMDRLINMQIEVANYALLVDVSSKIAGKTVQGMDTLMR